MTTKTIKANFKLNYKDFALDVSLTLPNQGVTAIFGPSGCGKTTLLRCIAGLEKSKGQLLIGDETWQDDRVFKAPHKRPIGYVFQNTNLFPHLNVMQNLNFGLKRVPVNEQKISISDVIALLDLKPLLQRNPSSLSGGEKQRVAIARALTVSPQLLLMDEPLAALDSPRKKEILGYIEKLHTQLKIPVLYVTHAPDEVVRLAQHLVVMKAGQVIANGSLQQTLANMDLPIQLGDEAGVVLDASITEVSDEWHLARADFLGGYFWIKDIGFKVGTNVKVRVLARDVSLALEKPEHTSISNLLQATVSQIGPSEHPAVKIVQVRVGKSFILARVTARSVASLHLTEEQTVWLQVKSVAIIE